MAKKKDFAFALKQKVVLKMSGEKGEVIGRAEYVDLDRQYTVRYLAADGRQVESWWAESAIRAAF